MGNCCASPLRAAIRDNDNDSLKQILSNAGESSGDLIDEDTEADCLLDWLDCSRKPASPLFTAVAKGNTQTVEILIQYGGDTNLTNHEGCNIMHVAAKGNKLKMVELLDKYNPSLVNMCDYDGVYPIHIASSNIISVASGNIDVLKYIVEKTNFGKSSGNKVFIGDRFGKTALDYAVKVRNSQAVEYLKSKNH